MTKNNTLTEVINNKCYIRWQNTLLFMYKYAYIHNNKIINNHK